MYMSVQCVSVYPVLVLKFMEVIEESAGDSLCFTPVLHLEADLKEGS